MHGRFPEISKIPFHTGNPSHSITIMMSFKPHLTISPDHLGTPCFPRVFGPRLGVTTSSLHYWHSHLLEADRFANKPPGNFRKVEKPNNGVCQVEEVDFLDFLENHLAIFRNHKPMQPMWFDTNGPVKSWKTDTCVVQTGTCCSFQGTGGLRGLVVQRTDVNLMSTLDHKSWEVGGMKFIQLMNRYNHPTDATKKPKKIYIERGWFLYHSYMCSSYWTCVAASAFKVVWAAGMVAMLVC